MPDSPPRNLANYAGRLVIPSLGPEGNVYDVAFRCILPHVCEETVLWTDDKGKDHVCPKYLFLTGVDKRLYNLRALSRATDTIEITEGQLDAATLEACGLHAIGVAGANGWKKHHHRLFQGFDRVRVWADGDVAGKRFAEKVCHDVASADVMMVPWNKDINQVFVEQGKEAILEIAEGEAEDDGADAGWFDEQPEWEHDSERPPF